MSVFKPVRKKVEEIPELTGKLYYAGALKNARPPFSFWRQTGGSTEQALDGYTDLHRSIFEIHVVGRNLDEMDRLAELVLSKIISLQGMTVDGYLYERVSIQDTSPDIKDVEVNLYRRAYTVAINWQEA